MRAFGPIFGSVVLNSLNADKPTKGMNNWQSCNPFSPHFEVGTITSLMWLQKTSQPGEVYLKLNPAPLNQNQFLIYTFSPLATELTKDDSLRTAQNYKLEILQSCLFFPAANTDTNKVWMKLLINIKNWSFLVCIAEGVHYISLAHMVKVSHACFGGLVSTGLRW